MSAIMGLLDKGKAENSSIGTTVITPRSLSIESSKNLISFAATAKQPIIGNFRNNVYFAGSNDKGESLSKEGYIEFIMGYLREQAQMFERADAASYISDMPEYSEESIKTVATSLYNKLVDPDPKALSNLYIATGSDTADLADFLHFYFNYTMLGTILAEATVLPNFSINRSDIPKNIEVAIKRNPSPYSHIIDPVANSFHSGMYRLLGYTHTITNSSVTTKLAVTRITFGTTGDPEVNDGVIPEVKDPKEERRDRIQEKLRDRQEKSGRLHSGFSEGPTQELSSPWSPPSADLEFADEALGIPAPKKRTPPPRPGWSSLSPPVESPTEWIE